jgi:hypothetical protein
LCNIDHEMSPELKVLKVTGQHVGADEPVQE